MRRALQTLHRLVVADLAGFEVAQYGVQLVELQLLQVKITEKIRGKGPQLLGRFNQPLQHGVGVDFEDPSRGTDAQALSQAGQDVHDEVDLGVFAVEEGAMVLRKIPVTAEAVELSPEAAIGMAIRP